MLSSVRTRIGAVSAAAAIAMGIGSLQHQPARAAAAYGSGFIAIDSGYGGGWTVVDPTTHTQSEIVPSGGSYEANTHFIWTLRYSPDARHVAFVARDQPGLAETLWVASADGTGAREVSTGGSDRIAWTPDGSRILFGVDGIKSVPADGSGTPTSAVPDPCASNPQVTTRGYIFYERACGPSPNGPSLAVYRPGDAVPSTVGTTAGSVSPDGTHVARVLRSVSGTDSITVDEIGGNSPGHQSAPFAGQDPSVVDFGPSGELVGTRRVCCQTGEPYSMFELDVFSDFPNERAAVLVAEGYGPRFLDWVNGPSKLPARPMADRIGGGDRIATAIDASRWAFDSAGTAGRRATVAVLARDDTYPDALAGTALAVQMGGPLLLTPSGALTRDVAAELKRVLRPGSTVYVLGGPDALRPAVADTVRQLGFAPARLGGPDRYATAVAIATVVSGTHPKSVLLATGIDFPDALTAGVAAGQERYSLRGTGTPGGGVVLLTNGTAMPPATLAYLQSLTPGTAALYAVGGPAAAAMHSVVPSSKSWTALIGADRYDTAAKVATSALYGNGAPCRYAVAAIATGLSFPDAMSGGALAGSQDAPLLLASNTGLSPAENAVLRAGHLADIAVIGGPAAVSNRILLTAADTAFGPHTWGNATNRFAPPLP